MRQKLLLILAGIMLLAILSGCSSTPRVADDGSSAIVPEVQAASDTVLTGEVKEMHISIYNFGFNQENVEVKKGDHVRLIFTSTDGTHGVMIPSLGLSTSRIGPGQEDVLEFDAIQAGTYEYFCNVPCGSGHKTMRGQFVVE